MAHAQHFYWLLPLMTAMATSVGHAEYPESAQNRDRGALTRLVRAAAGDERLEVPIPEWAGGTSIAEARLGPAPIEGDPWTVEAGHYRCAAGGCVAGLGIAFPKTAKVNEDEGELHQMINRLVVAMIGRKANGSPDHLAEAAFVHERGNKDRLRAFGEGWNVDLTKDCKTYDDVCRWNVGLVDSRPTLDLAVRGLRDGG